MQVQRTADPQQQKGAFPGFDPLIGSDIQGKYQVTREIGCGGMASIYQALDRANSGKVAIKFLKRDLLSRSNMLERFELEARLTISLRHPGIVHGIEYGVASGVPYYVMELIEGRTLGALISSMGHLDWKRTKAIALGLCEAAQVMHNRGIVHRDLKPDNVMISGGVGAGRPIVIDFGISHADDRGWESLVIEGMQAQRWHTPPGIMGTPEYVAPELTGGKGDPRTDTYSLGIMIYECLCGRPPFMGANAAETIQMHNTNTPTSPRALKPHFNIPETVDRLVMRAIGKEAEKRFQSAAEMAKAIQDT